MRVTESSMIGIAERGVSAARTRTANAANTMSSGVAVGKPSDDPAAWAAGARASARLRYSNDRGSAIGRASDRLNEADNALSTIGDALSEASALTTQLVNGGMSADERASGAAAIQDLFEQVYNAANQQGADGTYLFGGSVTDRAPYDRTGTYTGDNKTLELEVAPGRRTDTSIAGDLMATSSGDNVLAALSRIASALQNNDVAGARAELTTLSGGINTIANARSSVGGRMSALQGAEDSRASFEVELERQRTDVLAADPIRAASEFAQSQVALEGARQAAQQIIAIATRN